MSQNEIQKLYQQHCNCNPRPIAFSQFVENYNANKNYKLKQSAIKNTDLEIEDVKPKEPTNLKKARKNKTYPDYVECRKCHEIKHKSKFVPANSKRGHELTCWECRRLLAREK